jgi:biopolymer transport protein ExbD
MVVTQMLSSGVKVELPKAQTTTSVQDVGQNLVISIRPPLKGKEVPQMYVDRTKSDYENLVPDINSAYQDNPARSLLIKGSVKLKWKEAYGVMSTISEGGMTTMLLATEKE